MVGISARADVVERLDGGVRVVAVEQAEDRLALGRDPQALLPEARGELVDRLHGGPSYQHRCHVEVLHERGSPTSGGGSERSERTPLASERMAAAQVPCAAMSERMSKEHKALVTAPFRGEGLNILEGLADVVLDPWIEQQPMRLYNAEQLAARVEAEGADLLVVESDFVKGPVFDLPLVAIGSCRGDPNNVDVARRHRRRASPCCAPRAATPTRSPRSTVALLFAVNRGIVPADRDVRAGETYRDGTIPYQRFRAWQLAGQTAGIVGLGAVGRATKWRSRASA